MSNPHDSADSHQDELQFDEAEFTEPAHAVSTCNACQAPIADLYYEAGGKIVCDPCRHKIEAIFHGGSRLKALILGTIAAAVGAALYYAIIKITGWNIGLVAVLIGVMIGGAVKAGSGHRGGWFYQLMAVFLTYSAIVAMLLPDVLEGFQQHQHNRNAQLQDLLNKARVEAKAKLKKIDTPEAVAPKIKDTQEVAEKSNQTKAKVANNAQAPNAAPNASATDPKVSKTIHPITKRATTKEAPEQAEHAENLGDEPDNNGKPGIVDVNLNAGLNPAFTFLFIVPIALVACASPILFAFASPISGFIFAFALWEAWKMNRKVRVVINGPFHLAADQPMDLPAEDFDDGQ